jgi:magnesium transporter
MQKAISLATTAVPTCKPSDIVGSALANIQNVSSQHDSIDYIYVLGDSKLLGVCSLHELFSASPSATVSDVMKSEIAYVHADTDSLHIAELALAENIKAVPVVDGNGSFQGVVLANSILRILSDAHTGYLYKAAGIRRHHAKSYRELSFKEQIKTRSPWLIVGLFGGLLGAAIVNYFERSIADQVFVAAFIPAIVYIADAVGNQTEMLVVRALGRDRNFLLRAYLLREWGIGLLLSLMLGILMLVLSYMWLQSLALSSVLAVAIIATTLFSITFTVTLPWILKKIGFDPAVASGPLATVICDVSSVTIYLLIAATML